jgi:hypothetical protein
LFSGEGAIQPGTFQLMAWLLPVLNRAPAGAYRVISGTLIRSTQSVQFGFDWALMVAVAPEGKPRLDLPLMTNPGRPEPPLAGDETATLLGSLERERAILAWKPTSSGSRWTASPARIRPADVRSGRFRGSAAQLRDASAETTSRSPHSPHSRSSATRREAYYWVHAE